jgi:ribosomal protein S18 acetylase RimI-like enzyme
MAVDVRLLTESDVDLLKRVIPGVFDNPPDDSLCEEFLSDPRHHLAIAVDDNAVVGMASAVNYIHPDKPVQLWINEIGVAPAYRQSGLGRRLLDVLLDLGRNLGCREAWVCTEADNYAANRLYEAVGGKVAQNVMFTFALDDELSIAGPR